MLEVPDEISFITHCGFIIPILLVIFPGYRFTWHHGVCREHVAQFNYRIGRGRGTDWPSRIGKGG